MSLLQPAQQTPELALVREFGVVAPLRRELPRESPKRTRQIGKVAASLPYLLSNRDRLAENVPCEWLRELGLPEMRPSSLRPDLRESLP